MQHLYPSPPDVPEPLGGRPYGPAAADSDTAAWILVGLGAGIFAFGVAVISIGGWLVTADAVPGAILMGALFLAMALIVGALGLLMLWRR